MCAVLVMKRGRLERSDGIDMPNGETMKSIDEGEGINTVVFWRQMKSNMER